MLLLLLLLPLLLLLSGAPGELRDERGRRDDAKKKASVTTVLWKKAFFDPFLSSVLLIIVVRVQNECLVGHVSNIADDNRASVRCMLPKKWHDRRFFFFLRRERSNVGESVNHQKVRAELVSSRRSSLIIFLSLFSCSSAQSF